MKYQRVPKCCDHGCRFKWQSWFRFGTLRPWQSTKIFWRKFCWQDSNFKRTFQAVLRFTFMEENSYTTSLCRRKAWRLDIILVTRKSFLSVNDGYCFIFGSLWPNVREVYYKICQVLLQNEAILLQNIGIIRKYDEFIARRESC